jgi:hypothetical protein
MFMPFINDRDNIAGTLVYGYQPGSNVHVKPFRWTAATGTKEVLAGSDDGYVTVFGNDDWIYGPWGTFNYAVSNGAVCGCSSTGNAFAYLEGTPQTLSDTSGNSLIVVPAGVSSSDVVCGTGWSSTVSWGLPLIWSKGIESVLGVRSSAQNWLTGAVNMDDSGRVFGGDTDPLLGNHTALLWQNTNPGTVPVPVIQLFDPGVQPNAVSWTFTSMDNAGNIWGGYNDSIGQFHACYLSPPSNTSQTSGKIP